MGTWALLQVVVDIFAALGFFIIIMRMSRQPKDDPRLSRGLQLLQSKISVLEDLSDRTEHQVNQLSALLDQKAKEVQAKVQLAERSVHEIKVSMERSLDVAKIFQDKIPHQEIIERQSTIKYVQAARLAHQGLTAEQIAEQIDLPKGEIEFIAKVNRDQLVFNEEQLPWWAKQGVENDATIGMASEPQANVQANSQAQAHAHQQPQQQTYMGSGAQAFGNQVHHEPENIEAAEAQAARLRAEIELDERQRLYDNLSRLQFEMQNLDVQLARESSGRDLSDAFEPVKVESNTLQKLGEEFRKACDDANTANNDLKEKSSIFPPLEQLTSLIPQIFHEETALFQTTHVESPPPQAQAQAKAQAQTQAPTPAPTQDPALIRAAAQAKVAAALARSANARQPVRTNAPQNTSADLAAARLMARDAIAQQQRQAQDEANAAGQQTPGQAQAQAQAKAQTQAAAPAPQPSQYNQVLNSRAPANQAAPVIRKVEFPKIESP